VFTEVEVEPQTSFDQSTNVRDAGGSADNYELSGTNVELISDEEYSNYEERFKTVQSSDWIEDDEGEFTNGDNPVAKFMLRVIDAVFFVGEKIFLVSCQFYRFFFVHLNILVHHMIKSHYRLMQVGVPAIITTGSNISFRYFQAQNRGNGSLGWQQLKNIKRKKNQY
jgi:hypothetical protein